MREDLMMVEDAPVSHFTSAEEGVPPGYKRTEVGVIPVEWGVEVVKMLASISTGNKNTQDKEDGGSYPFFVRSQIAERINSYSYEGEAVLTAGDGVGVGKVFHYVNGRFDFHQRVYSIHAFNPKLLGFYFYNYFSSRFYERITAMTAKSSVDSVRMEMIAEMLIPLPGTDEQRAIATALSDADTLIASLDKLIAKKRDMKAAAMQQLLTGRERLPGFSGEWETILWGDAFQFLSTANNSRADFLEQGDVRYIHYGDIHTGSACSLDCAHGVLPLVHFDDVKGIPFVQDGDLVMVDASEDYEGIGKSVEVLNADGVRTVAGLHTLLMRGDKRLLADGFKCYLQFIPSVKSALMRSATGISVFGISKSNVKKIEILLPSLEEQRAIAAVLSDMDAEIVALEARRDKTRAIKQGMMQELLTGKTRLL